MRLHVILFLGLLLFVSGIAFANYLTISTDPFVSVSQSFNVSGIVYNSSGSGMNNVNISATISNSTNSSIYNSSNVSAVNGTFVIYLNSPASVGMYNITITTNASTPTFTMPLRVSSISFALISPSSFSFHAGVPFNISINLTNSSGSPIVGRLIDLEVHTPLSYAAVSGWTFTNLSNGTNSNGLITYTVTPSSTPGQYFILADGGVGSFFLNVEADSQMILSLEQNGDFANAFARPDNYTIVVRLRTSGGSLISAQNVSASILSPSGSRTTLTSSNFTESANGTYESNRSISSDATEGTYLVNAQVNVSGIVLSASTVFSVGTYSASIMVPSVGSGFRHEFEEMGSRPIAPNTPILLYFTVTNLSSGQRVSHDSSPSDNSIVNCSAVSISSVMRLANNTEYISSVSGSIVRGNTTYLGSRVCTIRFNTPGVSGFFRLVSQITYQNQNYSADYNFLVQNFLLKATTATEGADNEESFKMMSIPGSNVTILFTAYNISNGEALSGALVSNLNVTSIFHMISQTLVNNGEHGFNSNASSTSNSITITLPDDLTDMLFVNSQATIQGETVTATTPLISKRIFGWMSPNVGGSSGGPGGDMGPGGGGPGGPGFGGSEIRCVSGAEIQFRDQFGIRDAQGDQPISGVSFATNFTKVIQESTGQDLTSCINISSSTQSDANGSITANVTFACNMAAGSYFVLFNASYTSGGRIRTDSVPGGFKCTQIRANVMASPYGVNATTNSFMQVSRSGCILLNVSSVRYSNGTAFSTGNLSVVEASSGGFGGPGERRLVLSTSSFNNIGINSNGTALVLCPQNFSTPSGSSASSWSSGEGHLDIVTRICSPGNLVCQDFWSGLQLRSDLQVLMPFGNDASADSDSPPNSFNQPHSATIGSVVSMRLASYNGNITLNSVSLRRFGPFMPTNASDATLTFLQNKTSSFGSRPFKLYELNFTIPSTSRKSDISVEVQVTNSSGETGNAMPWMLTLSNVDVYVPLLIGDLRMGVGSGPGSGVPLNDSMTGSFGWNASFINGTVLAGASLNFSRNVCYVNNSAFNPGQTDYNFVAIRDSIMSQPFNGAFFANYAFLILDRDNEGTYDTLLIRNKSTPNSATNLSAFTILNVTNRSFVTNYSLLSIDSCNYFHLVYSGAISSTSQFGMSRNLGEYAANVNNTFAFVFRRSTTPISNSNVNITAIYKSSSNSFGLGTRLTDSAYSCSNGITNSGGMVMLTCNISSSGAYTLYWRINGSVANDSTNPGGMSTMSRGGQSTDPSVTIRNFGVSTSFIGADSWSPGEVANGSDMVLSLSNASNADPNFFNVTNAQFFPAAFVSTVNASYNRSSGLFTLQYRDNASVVQSAFCDTFACYSNSRFEFMNLPGLSPPLSSSMRSPIHLMIMGNTSSGNTIVFRFSPVRDSNSLSHYANLNPSSSASSNFTTLVCAQGYTFPRSGIVGANITSVTAVYENFETHSTMLLNLSMRDPFTDGAISSMLTGPAGCGLIKFGPAGLPGNVWPMGRPANIYFTINSSGNIETTDGRDNFLYIFRMMGFGG